jgi:GTP diphosphokinase / guanosine-3',5'-bis(diphosphate) 3'-diphosphatase
VETPEQVRVDRRGGLLSRLRPGEHAPVGVDVLLRRVKSYNPKADLKEIERAYRMAERSHEGQLRKTGEPFIEHPLGVASILAELRLDTTTLVAALLHDVVEDTDLSLEQIEREFGEEVGRIVDGLTKLDRITFRTREQAQAENVRKMIVAMARDIRVLLIKLADRLHNMRTLEVLSPQKQRQKATETLDIYAPLADRLGVHRMKWELEDLAFARLHPKRYEEIKSLVEKRENDRQDYLDAVVAEVKAKLRESKLKANVEGRPKHLYSVYEKMVLRGKELNEIYDLVGIRVLVDSVRDCYAALGAIHSLWKPVPGRFKDYIAMPKFNMYQSLHTTVIGAQGRSLEIQIRSHDMHRAAEYGIAAHWRYKEGRKGRPAGDEDRPEMEWLRRMLEWQQELTDPREFMEGLRVDLFQGQVFVFTPKGDVVALPAGATPIDFAYSIHTEVGHRCIGAKVAGKLVPLDYVLQNGDAVEVLTSKARDAGPSQDWLKLVRTPRARSKIRQWFSRERREDALDAGREALQRVLRKQGVPFKRLATEEALLRVAADLKYPSLDAMHVAIGEGQVSPQSVVARLSRSLAVTAEEDVDEVPLTRPVQVGREPTGGVLVKGVSDVWVKLARCCTPAPGDDIIGFVTRGQGVSVHRTDCPNVRSSLSAEADRFVEVTWRPGRATSFVVTMQVEALDRTRLLGDVANVLGDHAVNILEASSTVGKDRISKLRFTFELADIAHLSSILSAVKKVENVYDAYRVVPH